MIRGLIYVRHRIEQCLIDLVRITYVVHKIYFNDQTQDLHSYIKLQLKALKPQFHDSRTNKVLYPSSKTYISH